MPSSFIVWYHIGTRPSELTFHAGTSMNEQLQAFSVAGSTGEVDRRHTQTQVHPTVQ